MNDQEVAQALTTYMQLMQDEAAIVPIKYSEGLGDLKKIVRGLLSGELVLAPRQPVPEAKSKAPALPKSSGGNGSEDSETTK